MATEEQTPSLPNFSNEPDYMTACHEWNRLSQLNHRKSKDGKGSTNDSYSLRHLEEYLDKLVELAVHGLDDKGIPIPG